MFQKKQPAQYLFQPLGLEILEVKLDKSLDTVVRYRKPNGDVKTSRIRYDERGARYFRACGTEVYLYALRRAA